MPSIRGYRISIVILLALLAASSGVSAYLYELKTSDANNAVQQSANLDKQIADLKSQIASLSLQLDAIEHGNGPDSQASLKAKIDQLNAEINALQATNAAQVLEIQTLQTQVQNLLAQIANLTPIFLNGAGATFPLPFLSAVATGYTLAHSNVLINFQGIGSGAGKKALAAGTVDFAASDSPLSAAENSSLLGPALTVPETIGAVVVAYNVFESNGVTQLPTGLNLNTTVLAEIFLGNITSWDDPAIASLNPSIASVLPHQPIAVVHRSDSSGTTFIFTGYLNSAPGNVWKLGQETAPNGLVGLGASGNRGVAGVILGTRYTIGYVEFAYALSNQMKYSYIQNSDRTTFVQPSLANITYAVNNATSTATLPQGNQSWTGVSLLNARGVDSYPIVSFTYLLVYRDLNTIPGMTLDKAKALVDFLWYTVHAGQAFGPLLGYVPLTAAVITIDETSIRSMTFNGQSLPA